MGGFEMKDEFLWAWLALDVFWTLFLFIGAYYIVFVLGHSGWWFLLAIVLSPAMGGEKLYKALEARVREGV
jgi:hypothetical protein